MENKKTKIRDNGFKVTPEWLEAIGIDLNNWPTVTEAIKAKEEADILLYQGGRLFVSKPVKWVLEAAERKYNKEHSEVIKMLDAFNYGYILGIRSERARRKRGAVNED